MGKLQEIIEGWKNVIVKDAVIEEIALQRATACSVCPYNKKNVCSKCGCPLIAKTRSPKSSCPDNRW